MYDNINEINTEEPEKPHEVYEFKDEPIQLVGISDGMIEPTVDAINLLTALKKEKVSILSFNGPLSSGKSFLSNNILNKSSSGFKSGEKTQGIWIWGKPITLKDNSKLLVLDCQGLNKKDEENISHKLFILSVLLSTYAVYSTRGELNDDAINDFIYYTDLSNKINVHGEKNSTLNNIDNLKNYFPELIFVNDTSPKESIEGTIENNPLCDKTRKLFEKRTYVNSQNYQEILDKVQNNIKIKSIDNNIIDGDSLFGLIQNYIDFINDGDIPIIHSALENVLLSKVKNVSESVMEDFKNNLRKKVKYPMSINDIYKAYFELQQKHFVEFCQKVEKFATSAQTGEYIQKMCADMEKELESILETNKDYYDEWFSMEYNKLDQELAKLKFESIAQIKLFMLSYTSAFKNCLADFLKIPNSDFCQNLINVLSKIFQNFVVAKLSDIGDKINELYENKKMEFENKFRDEQKKQEAKEMQERKLKESQILETKKNMLIKQNESRLDNYKSSLMEEYKEKTRKKKEEILQSLQGDLTEVKSNFEMTKKFYEQQKLIFRAEQSARNATEFLDKMKHIIENKSNIFKNLLEQNYYLLKKKMAECEQMRELDNLSNKEIILQKIQGLLNMIFFNNIYENLYNDMVNEKNLLGNYLDELNRNCDAVISTLNSEKKFQLSNLISKPNFY